MRWASPRLGAGKARGSSFSDETPLRAELFNSDQMEQHGKRLASAHRLLPGRVPEQLLSRLATNAGVPTRTCDQLTVARHRITPAGE